MPTPLCAEAAVPPHLGGVEARPLAENAPVEVLLPTGSFLKRTQRNVYRCAWFTCFTSTKVQILTQAAALRRMMSPEG
jgi:hypothetical protein